MDKKDLFAFLKKKKEIAYTLFILVTNEKIKFALWNGKTILWIEKTSYSGSEEIETALSSLLKKLKQSFPSASLQKIILGLAPQLIEGEKIKSPYLDIFKKFAEGLSVKIEGFIDVPSAIASFLEAKEGSPQTMILVYLGKLELEISLFRVGSMTGHQSTSRSSVVEKDLEQGLKKFSDVEILPSKIYLYNEEEIAAIREKLMKYPWQNKAAFLHFPKIEILPENTLLDSFIFAAEGKLKKEEDLGFIREKNVKQEPKQEEVEKVEETVVATEKTPEREKIVVGFSLPKFSLPKIALPKFSFRWPLLIIVCFIALGAILTGLSHWEKTTVILLVDPKTQSQELEIKLDSDTSSVDVERKTIPGRFLDVEVKGIETYATTGKKTLGEAASGEVVIYNKTRNEKTFPKGSLLLASGLRFQLSEEVKIASASETADGLTYSKAKATIVAQQIGPEGNLTAGTEFKFADFPLSSYSARNETALSGGTSREVKVFSQGDKERIIKELTEALKKKAQEEAQENLISEEKILAEATTLSSKEENFDKKLNEEANEVTANFTFSYKTLVYKEKDINQLLEQVLVQTIPSGFRFEPENVETEVLETTVKDKTAVFRAKFKALLYPEIDLKTIREKIKGKTFLHAQEILRQTPHVVGVEFRPENILPWRKNKLPLFAKNINLKVSPR